MKRRSLEVWGAAGATAAVLFSLALTEPSSFAFGPRRLASDPDASPVPTATAIPLPSDAAGSVPSDEPMPAPSVEPVGSAGSAAAPGTIRLGAIALAGSGCAGAAAEVIQTSDEIILRLDQMAAIIAADQALDRKTCNLAIPVEAAAGAQAVIAELEVAGAYDLAAGDQAQVSVEAFAVGSESTKIVEDLGVASPSGAIALRAADVAASACGKAAILRANLAVLARREARISNAASIANVAEVRLRFKARACR